MEVINMDIFNKTYTMTIDGKAVSSDRMIKVINPANEEVIASAPDAKKEDLDAAVRAAKNAFQGWSHKTIEERSDFLCRLGDAIDKHKKEFMNLLTLEQGKPRSGADWEISGSIYWCKEIAKQRLDVEVIEETPEHIVERHHTPLGVVGAITPWNFPVLLAIWKIAPALMAGNTVVLKPSPYTPLCTLKLGEIAREILPNGVLNIVSGGNELGQWITEYPEVSKVSFTGSTETGKKVMQSGASNLKRVTLELGGNDAAIVLPDVDPKAIAKDLFWASFQNSAQFCVVCKRLYVHEDVYDEVLHELVEYAKTVKVGDGSDPESDLGPIQNRMQYEKVVGLIEDTKQIGAKIALGGQVEKHPGYFVPVTIVDNPPEDSRVVIEEAFGPVLPILKYRDYDEVVERANSTPYGLAGSIWGKNLTLAKVIAERLETGTVWINEVHVFSPSIPFGGHKQSGIGIENSLDGLAEYTNSKTIMVNKK
ncbi:aldehyde dehydrogenase family protein [Bacillus sp. FJAT-49705]|uniref:Aldehyde dehydrogenase family protein n=1 Tax=Cytobacillus citreus TaxID=2833586 RepID=A0ABS5NPJ6_9BACI|nr:aldehyde dehydrogenase family protein [Cytobacillus citreus]MBS4189751.1 aldehyde dehydrogenase family protein [Cytobacillus citreus]